jgi:hypothetical protein
VTDLQSARAPHNADPAPRLRSGAWLLQRSWRHPHRLPAGWRSERFDRAVDIAREQLDPIGTLSALADSFARESHVLSGGSFASSSFIAATPLEFAYLTRWIELTGGSSGARGGLMCGIATR